MRQISLRAARVDAGLTQEYVAKRMSIAKNTLIAWEKGLSEPKISQARQLCEIYGRPYDDIFFPERSD